MNPKDLTKILRSNDMQTLQSMSIYWEEVSKREDKTPLLHEIMAAHDIIGNHKMLELISAYVNTYQELVFNLENMVELVNSAIINASGFDEFKEAKAILEKVRGKEFKHDG